jgi:ferritin
MIDPKIEAALNQQINHELASAYNYLAMSAHFEHINMTGMARWMDLQREEENEHAMRLVKYVLARGGKVQLEAVDKPRTNFTSIIEVFEAALKSEQDNTRAINELYSLAVSVKDYATQSSLQWFLDEQVEEESLMDETLALVKLVGDDKSALLVLNGQLGGRKKQEAPAE